MGETRFEIITQTFCAVKETSSDSTKLLVSCCEWRISGLPKNEQEGKGWLSLGSPASPRTSRIIHTARREAAGREEVR